jgi:hypothetical protein
MEVVGRVFANTEGLESDKEKAKVIVLIDNQIGID